MGRLLAAAFLVYAALTLWVTLHHEPWRDEADPWLLMRDGDAVSIFRAASNRGVPLLFEAVTWPFARLGAPYLAQQLLNLVCVWAAVALLFRSPAFPTVVKVLIAFSYFASFEFAAIARPYGLQMLLTFAMAALWRERDARPVALGVVMGLLASTTTLGLVTAAVAGALLLAERIRSGAIRTRPVLLGTAVTLLGGLIAVAQLIPREGRQHLDSRVQLETLAYTITNACFADAEIRSFFVPALLVLALVTYGISRRALPVLFLWISGAALLVIYLFVWMGGLRHAGVLWIVVLAAIWMADAYAPFRRERLLFAALAVALAWSVLPAWQAWVNETRFAFSGSREVAAFIRERRLDREAVLVAPMFFWNSPLVYLPGTAVWYPAADRFGTYNTWMRDEALAARVPVESVVAKAERQLRGRRWVLIANRALPKSLEPKFRLRFRTSVPIWRAADERYWIYEPLGAAKPLSE